MAPTVASLALALHAWHNDTLEIAVPEGAALAVDRTPGVAIADGILRFASLVDRNRVVAQATLAQLGDHALQADALFEAAQRLWRQEITHADMASGRLLATVHPRRDVLAMAAEHLSGPHPLDVFNVLHMLEAMLPHVHALDWAALIALTEAQRPRTRGDGAAAVFFSRVREWLAAHPGSGAELTRVLLDAPREPLGPLLQAGWRAWAQDDPVAAVNQLAALDPTRDPIVSAAIGSLAGQLLLQVDLPAVTTALLEALVQRRLASSDPDERKAGLFAATQALHVRRGFDAVLRGLAEARDADALGYLALALAQRSKELLDAGQLFEWLQLCVALPVSQAGALRHLDFTLARYLRPGSAHREASLAFLRDWAVAQPPEDRAAKEFASAFGTCAGRILEDPPLLRRVLTEWFLDDHLALPAAAASLISGLGFRLRDREDGDTGVQAIALDVGLLDAAPDADLLLLARRLLGYVIDADLLLLLALSMLDVQDAKRRVHPLMDSLLGDEIGYDYPSTTIRRLRAQAAARQDTDTRALLERIAAQLEAYTARLTGLPRLRELTAPADLRRAFYKMRDRQQWRSMRDARRDSILAQIATTVHIKAGRTTFQYFQDRFTEPSGFKSVEYSFEMPRRESLDPVGNAFRLHTNRNAKRSAS